MNYRIVSESTFTDVIFKVPGVACLRLVETGLIFFNAEGKIDRLAYLFETMENMSFLSL